MADYAALQQAVISGKVAQVKELTQKALTEGRNAQEVLDQGLIPAMDIVGEKFSCHEFYIPEMLIAARAMQAGIGLLKPLLVQAGSKPRGKVVIGTVKGDLHDIGKNLVSLMLQGSGFEVVDLGADVKPERFVDAVKTSQPHFVMMSALLTTTMLAMKDTVEALKAANLPESGQGRGGRRPGHPALLRGDRRRLLLRECHRGGHQGEGVAAGVARC